MKNDKNLMTKNIIAITIASILIYRLGYIRGSKKKATAETSSFSNALGGKKGIVVKQQAYNCWSNDGTAIVGSDTPCPKGQDIKY
jgi:hypothetical protein